MIGVIISILLGIGGAAVLHDGLAQWTEWSFSALGERQTLSAHVFNTAVALSAVFMWGVAQALQRHFMRMAAVFAGKLTLVSVRTIAFCLFAVAIFPNDTQHELHYIFSRLLVAVFGLYAVLLPLATGVITRQQKVFLYAIGGASVMACLYGFIEEYISFVLFEAAAGALGMVWMYALCRMMQQAATTAAEADRSTAVPQKAS